MTQSLIAVIVFVLVLACIPFLVRWWKIQGGAGRGGPGNARVISAIAVGPHQRVVTVEVALESVRTTLILGVTPQSISCLHVAQVPLSSVSANSIATVSAEQQ